jgi:putative ATP-dependent endonuclease of OLD family
MPFNDTLKDYNYNTLENLMLITNNLKDMNGILNTQCVTENELRTYMKTNKTECALSVFMSNSQIVFPEYIQVAITHVGQ